MIYADFDPYGRAPHETDDFVFAGGKAYPKWANCGPIRPRESYPYSYSFFVLHGPAEKFEGVSGAYSDRMMQWDYEHWNRAWEAVKPANRIAEIGLGGVSKWLSSYYGRDIKCLQVLEGCNVSNGYPLWYFVWEEPAQAIEAGTAETGTGSVHESAVGNADAPQGDRP